MIKMMPDLPTCCSDYFKNSGELLNLIFFLVCLHDSRFHLKTFLVTTPSEQRLLLQASVQLVPGLFAFELHLLELCPVSHIFGVMLPGFTGIGLNLKENKERSSQFRGISSKSLVLLCKEST